MGYNIGMRLIEDFLARANPGRCYDLRDTADKIQVCFMVFIVLFNGLYGDNLMVYIMV